MTRNNAGGMIYQSAPDSIEVLLECAYDKALYQKIQRYGKILEYFPSLGYLSIAVPSHCISSLKEVEGIHAVYESKGISACMNQARKIIHAEEQKELQALTGKSVGIAFLDTGISPVADFLYPKNRIAAFQDFVYGRKRIYDDNGHGTQVWRSQTSHGIGLSC